MLATEGCEFDPRNNLLEKNHRKMYLKNKLRENLTEAIGNQNVNLSWNKYPRKICNEKQTHLNATIPTNRRPNCRRRATHGRPNSRIRPSQRWAPTSPCCGPSHRPTSKKIYGL